MNRHMEQVHNEKSNSTLAPKVACPHCDVNCKTYGEFNEHLTNNHGIKIEIENIQFNSMEGIKYIIYFYYFTFNFLILNKYTY